MGNPMIEKLEAERAKQFALVDDVTGRALKDGRELVKAENDIIKGCEARVGEIDETLAPMRSFEALRTDSGAEIARVVGGGAEPDRHARPLGQGGGPGYAYASVGAFIVDRLRARGNHWADIPPDPQAAARMQAAVATQTTADTTGLLPTPVVGQVINTIDASRPFITSVGSRPMGGIPGTQFTRPKIAQHVTVGEQVGEKTELPSQKMIIGSVPFNKKTYGGTVNISRQDIDWTNPSAWDALVTDLANVYGAATENVVADAFVGTVTQSVTALTADLAGWVAALYDAAAMCYAGGAAAGSIPMGKLPNRLWMSLDMWATFGSLVDQARVILNPGALGSGDLTSFAGDMLGVPRVVVGSFPAGTAVLGPSDGYEVYEETIGLLTAVEPSIFGVEVAYGGYIAHGMLTAPSFCKIVAPAGMAARSVPTVAPSTKAKNGTAS